MPATNGPLILLINSIQENNRSDAFAAMLVQQHLDSRAAFTAALAGAIGTPARTVTMLPADGNRTELIKEYGELSRYGVDAVLDVVVTKYGYYAATQWSPFTPDVGLEVRLVGARDRAVLMQDILKMVDAGPPAGPQTSFQDYSDLTAAPVAAVTGVRLALDEAAARVRGRMT